jgi:hypothetical protein
VSEGKEKFLRPANPTMWGAVASVLVVGVAIFVWYFGQSCVAVSDFFTRCTWKSTQLENASPNEIGDTLAGFAGTLAFIWIVVTVAIQSKELSEQREQLKQQTNEFKLTNNALAAQRFDQAFFGLLSTYNQIISDLDLSRGSRVTKGRDCFVVFKNRLEGFCSRQNPSSRFLSADQIQAAYDMFWQENQSNLGHYFRFLYNAFRFISENEDFARPHHSRLLRSQLSDQELQLLFYNCLSRQGVKFLVYAKKYALFNNLPHDLLFDLSHVEFMPLEAWGDNEPNLGIA